MRQPTDDEIMRALCCGGKCAVGPNTGLCHRWDFTNEAARIRALLERHANTSDIPEADEAFFKKAKLIVPDDKKADQV